MKENFGVIWTETIEIEELETKLRQGELHSALVSHLSKLRSLIPAF